MYKNLDKQNAKQQKKPHQSYPQKVSSVKNACSSIFVALRVAPD